LLASKRPSDDARPRQSRDPGHTLKGSVEGKTYIGPGPDPAGAEDREVVSFDGRR
jgi:hypothetical protein